MAENGWMDAWIQYVRLPSDIFKGSVLWKLAFFSHHDKSVTEINVHTANKLEVYIGPGIHWTLNSIHPTMCRLLN